MKKETKEYLTVVFLLGLCLVLLILGFYAFKPRFVKHVVYQFFPGCWSCQEGIWTVDENHSVTFRYPENWEITQADTALVIHSTEFIDSGLSFIVQPISFTSTFELDMASQLEAELSSIFVNYQEYEGIDPAQNIDFGGNSAAKIQVRAVPHIEVDETLQAALGDFTPTYIQELELFLVSYDGQYFLISTSWRLGTQSINPWGYDQMEAIVKSVQFE